MGGIERNAAKSWDQKRISWRSWGPGRAGGCVCVPLNILLHSQSGNFQTPVLTQRCHPNVWVLLLIWGQLLPGENPNSAAFWGLVPQHVTYLRKCRRAMCQRLTDQHPAFEIRIHRKEFFLRWKSLKFSSLRQRSFHLTVLYRFFHMHSHPAINIQTQGVCTALTIQSPYLLPA
jgi:hypothetical protein